MKNANKVLYLTAIPLRSIACRLCGALYFLQFTVFIFFTIQHFVQAAGAVAFKVQSAIGKADLPEFFVDVIHQFQIEKFASFIFRHFNPRHVAMMTHANLFEPQPE